MGGFALTDLLVGLGLMLVLEGLIYALGPGIIRRMAVELPNIPDSVLRTLGLLALCAGVVIVWLARG